MSNQLSQTVLLRSAAFLIDGLLVGVALTIPTSLVSWILIHSGGTPPTVLRVWLGALGVLLAAILIRDVWRGRSPGKVMLGLRVETRDGRPCGIARSVLRNLPMIIPGLNLIEIVLVMRPDGRRMGDRLAGTTVTEE